MNQRERLSPRVRILFFLGKFRQIVRQPQSLRLRSLRFWKMFQRTVRPKLLKRSLDKLAGG